MRKLWKLTWRNLLGAQFAGLIAAESASYLPAWWPLGIGFTAGVIAAGRTGDDLVRSLQLEQTLRERIATLSATEQQDLLRSVQKLDRTTLRFSLVVPAVSFMVAGVLFHSRGYPLIGSLIAFFAGQALAEFCRPTSLLLSSLKAAMSGGDAPPLPSI